MMNGSGTLPEKVNAFIAGENLLSPDKKLFVAVSGGLDSVVLCHLLHQSGYNFTILHCNFKLRGEESERDEAFVRHLAEQYGCAVQVESFNTKEYAESRRISVQLAARELRYRWFDEVMGEDKKAVLLTAHHADDNMETMLMNIFRGSGLRGVRGILPKQQRIVRPLLCARRKELEEYAKEHQLQWVEDSSNLSDKYTRNFFRHHVIPVIKERIPSAEENLENTLKILRKTSLFYEYSIERTKRKLFEPQGRLEGIPVLKLKSYPGYEALLWEIIQEFGFTFGQLQDVLHLLEAETGKYVQSPTHRIIRNRKFLLIAPLHKEASADFLLVEHENETLELPGCMMKFSVKVIESLADIPKDPYVAVFPLEKISFPLIVRKWKKGDYFYPFGMKKKKKKLSRFFIDLKLSAPEKESQYVLEMDKKILWVIGRRTDERFMITRFPVEGLVVELKIKD